MVGAGAAFDFAINISKATQKAVEFLSKSVEGIAKAVSKATAKGVSFVSKFLDRVDSAVRKKGGFFDKARQRHIDALAESTEKLNRQYFVMAEVTEGLNVGMGFMNGTIARVMGAVYLLREGWEALAETNDKVIEGVRKNFLSFGSMQNGLSAYSKFQSGIISGTLKGETQDFVDAAAGLNKIGALATDELMQNASEFGRLTGEGVTGITDRISSFTQGDLAAFDEFFGAGEMLKKYKGLEGTPQALRDAIIKEINGATDILDAAKKMPLTFKELGQQMSEAKNKFLQAIFGNTMDPNSFASQVVASFQKAMAYFQSKAEDFKKIAGFLSGIFKALWTSVTQIFNSLIRPAFEKFFEWVNRIMGNWKDTVTGIQLYIALVTVDIINFLKEYGKYLLWAYKLMKLWAVAQRLLTIGKAVIQSVGEYFYKLNDGITTARLRMMYFQDDAKKVFSSAGKYIMRFSNALRASTAAQWLLNIAMLANPVGLIIIAVLALIGWIVYLITHWEEVRVKMQGVSDSVLVLIALFLPIVGIPLILAKHWEKFKVIFQNIWATVYNTVMGFWYMIKYYAAQVGIWFMGIVNSILAFFSKIGESIAAFFAPIGQFFVDLWDSIYEMIPDWLKDFGGWLYDSIVSVGTAIGQFFLDLWDRIKPEWLDDLLDWLGDGTEKTANASASFAEEMAKKAGATDFKAKKGVSNANVNEAAAAKKALEEKNKKKDTPVPVTPVTLPTTGAMDFAGGGDTINNNVTINVPVGSSTAEITKIVEQVLAKNKRKADTQNQ